MWPREQDAPGRAAGSTADAPVPEGRLRILQVILSRGFAGSERAAAEACNALAQRHDVALVIRSDHRGRGGASVRDALDAGIEVFEIPAWWRTRHRLQEVIRAWRPDVIHTHLRRGTRYVALCRPAAVHVCTVHLSINGPHYLLTDGMFCISEWQLATVPGSYRGKAFLVPNSFVPHPRLDAGRVRELRATLGAGDDEFLVGAVGRLASRKGFDLLIRAFEQAGLPNARLVIAGDGSERRALEKMAGDRVKLIGFRHDVKDLYQAFDVFVCPSSYEPFGRVIVEALDGGVPVIASDSEGPRDLAGRYPIELVPRDDVEQLSAALRRAHAAGRRRVQVDLSEFDLQLTAERMVAAYRQLIAVKTPPAGKAVTIASPSAGVEADGRPLAPRFLFAPVSGPGGSGELMRCLIVARELLRAEPAADIRFLVSRTAVFREAVEFPIVDCDASPTKSTPQVLAAIESFRPHVMVFDNSGRTSQLRAAKRAGARIVFSSRVPKLRWKAFRIKWMRLLDEHWMVFPTFVTGDRTWLEQLKLGMFPGYTVRQFDTLFTPSDPGLRSQWLARRGLHPGAYVVFVPGGRSEGHLVAGPAELFIAAARAFVAETGCTAVVLTGRNNVPAEGDHPGLMLLPRIGPEEVQHLLAEARLVVSNGGTTLIHSLAHGRPIIAVPLAGDQDRRIRRAAAMQIAIRATRDAGRIAAEAAALLRDNERRADMLRRIEEVGFVNGVTAAVDALIGLARTSRT
jgi:glycosyltransferase involved in cell wall biosynthesis/putative intracellular protease/amidase